MAPPGDGVASRGVVLSCCCGLSAEHRSCLSTALWGSLSQEASHGRAVASPSVEVEPAFETPHVRLVQLH